jgi:hypothetical protein
MVVDIPHIRTLARSTCENPLPLVVAQSQMTDPVKLGVFELISGLVMASQYRFDKKRREEFRVGGGSVLWNRVSEPAEYGCGLFRSN